MAVSKKYNKETQKWEEVDFGGSTGASAYEVAVKNGFKGTEQEWLESLKNEVDETMSDTSTNAVQNKVIKKYVDDKFSSLINGNEVKY